MLLKWQYDVSQDFLHCVISCMNTSIKVLSVDNFRLSVYIFDPYDT